MSLLSKIFGWSNVCNTNTNTNEFNIDEYNNYNNKKIKEFTDKYDLNTIEGIMAIPISEAKKYTDINSISVVYMPEQILNRKATEYKNEGKYDMAIECLKKANELLPYSPFSYTRKDYERLVDVMILAERFNEAKEEHQKLDREYGTRLEELKKLQKSLATTGTETKSSYQKRIIDPYILESNAREQYYWILENKPDLAPKSYGAYRNMKNKETPGYLKIVKELKNIGENIDTLKFWY